MTEKASTENSTMEAEDKLKKTWVQEIGFTTQKQLETEKHNTGSVFLLNNTTNELYTGWLMRPVLKSYCRLLISHVQ